LLLPPEVREPVRLGVERFRELEEEKKRELEEKKRLS
jgi:hypothetical protein